MNSSLIFFWNFWRSFSLIFTKWDFVLDFQEICMENPENLNFPVYQAWKCVILSKIIVFWRIWSMQNIFYYHSSPVSGKRIQLRGQKWVKMAKIHNFLHFGPFWALKLDPFTTFWSGMETEYVLHGPDSSKNKNYGQNNAFSCLVYRKVQIFRVLHTNSVKI